MSRSFLSSKNLSYCAFDISPTHGPATAEKGLRVVADLLRPVINDMWRSHSHTRNFFLNLVIYFKYLFGFISLKICGHPRVGFYRPWPKLRRSSNELHVSVATLSPFHSLLCTSLVMQSISSVSMLVKIIKHHLEYTCGFLVQGDEHVIGSVFSESGKKMPPRFRGAGCQVSVHVHVYPVMMARASSIILCSSWFDSVRGMLLKTEQNCSRVAAWEWC